MLVSYSTGSYVDDTFHSKTETDTLVAYRLTNTGNIDFPGWLDIGTSGYTNSRIRCNAVLSGYTGYAELRAATSYDMFPNLQTTYPNGGWMYFKSNSDDYMQLSGSDNKVNIYKDTSLPTNLTINGDLDSSKKFPLNIENSFIQSFGHLHHFTKKLQTVDHGFNFHEMEQVILGRLECLMTIHM